MILSLMKLFPSLLYLMEHQNSVAKPLITDIYTDYDEIISYVQELETRMGRKLKMAEETKDGRTRTL